MGESTRAGDPARKRKRVELDVAGSGARSLVQESHSSSDFSVSTVSKDVLEISDANPDAKFIKVTNTSADKVQSWDLMHAFMFIVMHSRSGLE